MASSRPRHGGGSTDLEIAKNRTPFDEFLGFCELLQGVHQGLCG